VNTLPDTAERPVVLVVDDEPEILVALTDLLDQTYHVLAASSGEEDWPSCGSTRMWRSLFPTSVCRA
jgi:response regulator RpfG family c-di-GMP phosphodiesterase